MQISKGWLARIAVKVRALFASDAKPVVMPVVATVIAPSIMDMPLIDAAPVRRPMPRMLSARIACQAKLNVRIGKKARLAPIVSAKIATRRPKVALEVKKTSKVRSVYLPARHLAAKTRPKSRSNVIMLPVAAKATKPQLKGPVAKALRIAA